MKIPKLLFIVVFTLGFLCCCNDNNPYYSPQLGEEFLVKVPVSWDSIIANKYNDDNQSQKLSDKFVGDPDMLTGMQFQKYNIENYNNLLLDTLLERQSKILLIDNISTEILQKGEKKINGRRVGFIRYLFTKNSRKCYGEISVQLNGRNFYIFDVYSMKDDPKVFQSQCTKVIESISFLKEKRER